MILFVDVFAYFLFASLVVWLFAYVYLFTYLLREWVVYLMWNLSNPTEIKSFDAFIINNKVLLFL